MAGETNKGIRISREGEDALARPAGRNHLLVIAIDEYAHCPKLNNCVKDAREFIEVLTGKYQFDPEHITTLYNAEATRANILARLNEQKQKIQPEDNLVVYFSGHGETEDDVGYWVPVAAHPENNWEFISTYDIKSRLDPIPSFHTFVIVDACFSGSLFAAYKSVKAGYETKRSRLGLAASHSRERALDGTAGENSPFAATLLKKLRESPEDLSVQRLATEVIEEVQGVTRGRQTPVFKPLDVKGDDSGLYVFRLRASEETIWEDAEKENSIRAYNRYLDQFPRGYYSDEALTRIQSLEDDQEWGRAGRTDRVFAYRNYLRIFPTGHHVDAARKRTAELEMEEKQGPAPVREPAPARRSVERPKEIPEQTKPQPNTFTDPRDGQEYCAVELNGLRWMAQNLNFDVGEECWFYEDDPKNGEKYGRLYTWEAAKKACPPGWRLPTDEEWRQLAIAAGGYSDQGSFLKVFFPKEQGNSKQAYTNLLEGGSTGFSTLLGGWRTTDGSFVNLGVDGNYWSATEQSIVDAWNYSFNGISGKLYRVGNGKGLGFSCRCTQDLTI